MPPSTSRFAWCLLLGCAPSASSKGTLQEGADTAQSADPACTAPSGTQSFDEHGGDTRVTLEATGYFRVDRLCGRSWLVTPEGHPFYTFGVNDVQPRGSTDRVTGENRYEETVAATYASTEEWAEATVSRLLEWGWNTAGAWSDVDLIGSRMPYTAILGLSGGDWQSGTVPDYFDPSWQAEVEAKAAAGVRPGDPNLVGYFIDNEIRWGPDWRSPDTLLQTFLDLPADAPGKQEAVRVLLDTASGLDDVNALLGTQFDTEEDLLAATGAWSALAGTEGGMAAEANTAFLVDVASRYFEVTTTAIREADPDHLILGNREVAVLTRGEVYEAAARWVDVLSVNDYTLLDGVAELAEAMSGGLDPSDGLAVVHALVDLPIIVSEFGYRAADSGLPNSYPPIYPTYETQSDRADAFEEFVEGLQAKPWIVGYHWFRFVDEPANGRFDGEDNNWGLVSEEDVPYDAVVERTAQVNPEVWSYLEVPE